MLKEIAAGMEVGRSTWFHCWVWTYAADSLCNRHHQEQVQWNLSIEDTTGTQLAVLYREVSPIQRLICTHLYVVGTANSVLISEVFCEELFHLLHNVWTGISSWFRYTHVCTCMCEVLSINPLQPSGDNSAPCVVISSEDFLDDGTPIRLKITIDGRQVLLRVLLGLSLLLGSSVVA